MTEDKNNSENWDIIVRPETGWFQLHLKDIWRYRDLIVLLVKRDFVTLYKQTVLGCFWYLLGPIFTTVVFTIIFGKVAHLPTDGIPPFLFYLSGTITWNYFATCLAQTSNTFLANAGIFGKVYFPRLTVPISNVIISLVKFGIQFALFIGFLFYFILRGSSAHPNLCILLLPVIIIQMALLGMGFGILISSFTTKYRDLSFMMGFAVQLWMFLTPVIYPASAVPQKYQLLYMLNPMAPVLELFRYAFMGEGITNPVYITISWLITLCVLFAGILFFNKTEKNFMDTV